MVGHLKSAATAFALSSSSVFILLYGLSGINGSSAVTGLLLLFPLCCIAASCVLERRGLLLNYLDLLFACFVVGAICSYASHPGSANSREVILFIICALVAYPAGRCIQKDNLEALRDWCFGLSGVVLVIGTMVTIAALTRSWDEWRPDVFGFPHAPTEFSMALAYFSIAFVSRQKKLMSVGSIAALCLISLSAFAYSASLVRFTLAATIAVIFTMFVMAPRKETIVVLAVLGVSIAVGSVSRSTQSAILVDYAETVLLGRPAPHFTKYGKGDTTPSFVVPPANMTDELSRMPSCTILVNLKNSLSLRKALYLDAFALFPTAGIFGHGLQSFPTKGCLSGLQVHNIFAQALIELGWVAGAALALLALIPGLYLLIGAFSDDRVRFLFSIFAVTTLVSLGHGSVNRDLPAFLLIGAAAGLVGSVSAARIANSPNPAPAE